MTKKNTRIPLAEATTAQLMEFIQFSGLEIKETASRDEALATLGAAGIEHIQFVTATPAGEGQDQRIDDLRAKRSGVLDEEPDPADVEAHTKWLNQKVQIQISTEDKAGGDEPVPLKCNNRTIWVPRGKPVMLARKFVHILANAKRTVYDHDDQDGLKNRREVPAFPWHYV